MSFGIAEISNRHCKAQGCKRLATKVVGNTRYRYNLKNLFLCDEHLKEVYEELKYHFAEPVMAVEGRNSQNDTKGQDVLKGYVKLAYESNGMLSKAKLAEFCKENEIDVPEEANIKIYMETLFPELKQEGD